VKFLDLEEKYMELAKMLSSDPPTHAALQNAKELLSLKIN
jgi:DNA repair ATPase RecN